MNALFMAVMSGFGELTRYILSLPECAIQADVDFKPIHEFSLKFPIPDHAPWQEFTEWDKVRSAVTLDFFLH
jgi:hypothetical protein